MNSDIDPAEKPSALAIFIVRVVVPVSVVILGLCIIASILKILIYLWNLKGG